MNRIQVAKEQIAAYYTEQVCPRLGKTGYSNESSLEHTSPCSTPGPHENSQEKLQQHRKMVLRKTYNAEIQYKSKTP